jgi:uroporphyrinogen decarboxylase
MNSLERVLATMQGNPVDRVPVAGVLCLYGARLTGCALESYYTKSAEYARGQNAIVDQFHPDMLLSPLCTAQEAFAFGCEIKYFGTNPPNITRRAIGSAEEIGKLKFPDIDTHPSILYIRETVRMLAEQYKGQIPIAAIWMDPFDMLANAIGIETFLSLLFFHRPAFDEVICKMDVFCVKYGNALLSDGAALLANFVGMCNVAMLSRDMAERMARPVLEKAYAGIKGGILLHHGGYKIAPYIDLYRDLPNMLGFIIDPRDSLIQAREKAGDHLLIAGNIDGPTLNTRTPEQISLICSRMLAKMESDSRYVLCTSAADIPYATDESQIRALMTAPGLFANR